MRIGLITKYLKPPGGGVDEKDGHIFVSLSLSLSLSLSTAPSLEGP